MAPRFKKMHFLNHPLLMLSSTLLFVALTNCIRVGSHLPHLPHHQLHQRQSFPSSNRRTSDGQFFFFATKDGLEVVPSGTKSGFVPLGTQNSGRFSDFATLINSNLKSSSSSSSFLDDNLKEETTRDVSQIRHAGKYRQMAFDKANLSAQPQQPQPPRPQPRISFPQQAQPSAYEQTTASNKPTKIASSPVFGARLSSVATSSIQAKSTVSNNTAPTITTQPRPTTFPTPTIPTINRQKHSSSQTPSKSNSTLLEMLEECEHDDEGEVDYIDNRDERLVGVTHLNISQDDLWNAESQAMEQILTAYGTKTQVPNLTHIIPEASEQSLVKTPMDPKDLGLDLGKSKSPEIDFSALFKDYKSPGIPFDPFKVFEQENGIVSEMPSSIPQNLIKSNTFEYFADNPTSSQIPSRQFETKPDFVPFGTQQGQNNENPKHFEWTPTRFSSTTSSASTFPSSSTSVLPDQTSTPSMGPTESAFQSEFVSTQENIDNSINTNVNENGNNNEINIEQSNRSTLSSSSSISAQPQSNDSSLVTNVDNSQQLASFDPKSAYENLRSVRKDYADPVIDPDDNFKSSQYGPSQSTTPGSNTSPFFSDYKLSSDFYSSNRAIPSRYLSKQDSFNGHNGNTVSIRTGDSHWRGLTNYQQSNVGGGKQIRDDDGVTVVSNYQQPQQQVNIRQHNEITNLVTTPTEVPIVSSEVELSPNGRPIIRLIPKASVEIVPLPPPGEYNEPEIIHSGDYVVKVEKVPLKNLHDAYYNPEIPGETSLSSSSANASTATKSPSLQVKNAKTSNKSTSSNKLRNKNGKSQKSKGKSSSNTLSTRNASKSTSKSSKSKQQSSKAKTSARQETNKDKQEEEDTSLESPVIDDVTDAAKNITSNGADVDKVTSLGDSAVKNVTDGTTEVQDEVEDEIKGDEDKGSKETETEDEKKVETDKTETESDKSETEKEETTSEKPETEEEVDTETSTEKPEEGDNGSVEEKKEEDSEDTETSSESPSADTDDTSSDSTATTERPETTTTTTTPKPYPSYPPFPFPPPFPPFFFPPPYPPPHGGRYPPLPYPPPPGAPYPPMPYPPPPPGYPPMPYGLPPPMYRPPGSSPPPPSPPPSYQPRPVSYTYTNAPQPAKPYGSQYQPPPPPPPSYQNSIAQNYGGSKYPKGYGSREPKVEFNGIPFEKTINLNSNNNQYPKPQSYNNNYQYPQQQQPKPSYYQYSHGRRNDGAQPPHSQQRSGYGGSGYGYPKETVQNIHADIFLGDTKYPDNGYSQPLNSYPPNGHTPYYPPSSYESVNPPAYPTYPTYPQQPETAKKPTYYERFANRVKKLLPKLRISSGDPYPPKLDENYKQMEKDPVAKGPISSPWNEMTLGELEVDPNPPPVLYSCDKNRIGKCVLTHDQQQQFSNFPAMDSLQQQTFDGMEQPMVNPFPAVTNEPVAIAAAAAGQQQLQLTGSSINTVTK